MRKRTNFTLWLAVLPVLLALACQLPSISWNRSSQSVTETPQTWPSSTFVPPRQLIQVFVDEPLALESYHVSRTGKLNKLWISVNGQPLRDEQNAEFPFPGELASFQVLRREESGLGQPAELPAANFPSPFCRRLAQNGRLVQRSALARNAPLELEFPASTWTVCHVWMGHKPGTYDLTIQVTDEQDRPGNVITQRIEVLEP